MESVLGPDGRHLLEVSWGPDGPVGHMTRDEGVQCAQALLAVAAVARFYAAVARQLMGEMRKTPTEAATVILALQRMVGQDDWHAGPVTVSPGYRANPHMGTYKGVVQFRTGSRHQWVGSAESVHGMAAGLLELAATVDCDTHYYQLLTEMGKFRPEQAERLVRALGARVDGD